jgi:hypothetical protein
MTNNSRAVHDAFAVAHQAEERDAIVLQAVGTSSSSGNVHVTAAHAANGAHGVVENNGPLLALPFRRSRTYETPRTTNVQYLNSTTASASASASTFPMKMKPSSPGIETVATDDSDMATTDCHGTASTTNGTTHGRHPNDHNEEEKNRGSRRKRRWKRHHPTVTTSIPTAPTATTTAPHRRRQLLTEFGPKLILEVMGGAGAVWGFSEIVGLRTSATLWFWRPCAATVGLAFFVRFLHQLASAWKTTHGRHHRCHHYEDYNHNNHNNNDHHDLELGIEMSPSTCSSTDSNSHLVDSNPSPLYHRHHTTSTTMSSSADFLDQQQPLSPNEWTALTSTSISTSNTLSMAAPMAMRSTHNNDHIRQPMVTKMTAHRGVTG